ncbi:Zinc finger MYM-type protein 1 [Oopsacas minuta]|uniref:Zinc finger MYM-type protein 1 n=1 Tax=Oopsacas minuta TaxID=111878 RepID=A0AAV7JHD3_9METZ|nr:Zinc finger MYM-type protein 1 [Oopsacas minuta]
MHTEQQTVDNSVLEINSSTGMIQDINTDWSLPQDIGCKKDGPAQPLTPFPAKSDCNKRKTNRFQASWYSKHPWITNSESQDKAFCFPCIHFSITKLQDRFTKKGFHNWQVAVGDKNKGLDKHARCESHIIAIMKWEN